jgi:hypothetical protein
MRDSTKFHLWGITSVILALSVPVALSAVGAAYFGFKGTPYLGVIIWALISAFVFLWLARRQFVHALVSSPYAMTEQDIREIQQDGEARGWSPEQIADALEDERAFRKSVLQDKPPSTVGRLFLATAILAIAAVGFIAGDSLIYLLVRSIMHRS